VSFSSLIARLTLPGEVFILQHKGYSGTPVKDEEGTTIKTWNDIHIMTGIIQEAKSLTVPALTIEPRGEEELPQYKGFFVNDFAIDFNELGNYRIEHTTPTTSPQTVYYQIQVMNRNLRLRKKEHHYEMLLGVNPKW
jgi:hypothetical protein